MKKKETNQKKKFLETVPKKCKFINTFWDCPEISENDNQHKIKGITLIALIITIIVMLILVAVTINVALNEGLFTTAKQATEETQYQADYETLQAAIAASLNEDLEIESEDTLKNNLPEGWNVEAEDDGTYTVTSPNNNVFYSGDILGNIEVGEQKNTITTEDSYVGYYADIDGDEEVDGVIYADLAFTNSGYWGNSCGTWSYEAITDGLKDYYISQTAYEGNFGTQDVISPVAGGEGKDRFYVMALEDLDNAYHYWYYNAMHSKLGEYYNVADTDDDFGKGRENTQRMIKSYEEEEYGAPYTSGKYTDMWGMEELIKKATEEGGNWFVPSKSEWAAFGDAFNMVTMADLSNFGLNVGYWLSSVYLVGGVSTSTGAFCSEGLTITGYDVTGGDPYKVRLSTTF